MKKVLMLIVLFSCCLISLFSATSVGTMYLRPMPATSGIPLNPPVGKDTRYTPINTSNGLKSSQNVYVKVDRFIYDKRENLEDGQYSAWETMAIGGVQDITRDAKKIGLQIDIIPQDGFYMTSLSNPSYKRPYELYLIPQAVDENGDERYGAAKVYGDLPVPVRTHDISFEEMQVPCSNNYNYNTYSLYFDLVLVLDGDIINDEIKFKDKLFPLAIADDYSSKFTIMISPFKYDDQHNKVFTGEVQQIVVPVSGFFSHDPASKSKQKVTMHINPKPAAGNLDMRNYGRQDVAEIKISAVYEYDLWDVLTPNHAYAIFLSSSPDPYTAGEPFLLKKDDIVFPEPATIYNSVGYTAFLKSKTYGDKAYTGTARVDDNVTTRNVGNWPDLVKPTGKEVPVRGHRSRYSKVYDYDATLGIEIENNSGIVMEAGRYESSIYIHIITLHEGVFQ